MNKAGSLSVYKIIDEREKKKTLRMVCAEYIPKPIVAMDDEEACRFAEKQARNAASSIPMKRGEVEQYASAVLSSILYFNTRSKEHHDIMRYREECRATEIPEGR